VSPFALSLLKYALLILLYLFVYRAIRSVVLDVGGRRRGTTTEPQSSGAIDVKASKGRRRPSRVVVHEVGEGGRSRTVRLSGEAEIGRSERCAIRLEDHYVSQVHARLFERDGTWHVEDMGSTNGTFLNDGRVAGSAEVHAGDAVKIGKTVLELRR